jgi:hypothetical protein
MLRQKILACFKTDPIRVKFDPDRGIPFVDYGTRMGIKIGPQINPLFVALYACVALGLQEVTGPIFLPPLSGASGDAYVHAAVEWLVANEKRMDDFSVWECHFLCPPYLKSPWRSALTEAYGALVLLKVGKTEDTRRHLKSLTIDSSKGGVSCVRKDSLWFLEYVNEKSPLVLNGMMSCLIILSECARQLGDQTLLDAFNLGLKTLKRDLHIFDAGLYTYYDSRGNPADEKYHNIHIAQLRLLYQRTGDQEILAYHNKWMRYVKTYPILEPLIFVRHVVRSGGSLIG